MVSFGIGLGQFLDGATSGLEQGQKLKTMVEDGLVNRKMKKLEKTARGEADATREADISKAISTTIDPNTGAETYKVGTKDFGMDGSGARKAAAMEVGSFTDYYMKTAVPQLVEGYMRAGKPQEAQQYQTWMETDGAKRGLKHWATAARAASRGDTSQFVKSLKSAYATPGYYDDGVEIAGHKELKDKDGNITGLQIDYKGADGQAYSQTYQGIEDVYRQGLMVMSPDQVFQYGQSQIKSAEETRSALAKEKREYGYGIGTLNHKAQLQEVSDDRTFKRQLTRDGFQHNYRMEEDNNSAAVRAAYGTSDSTSNAETPEAMRKSIETIMRRMGESDLSFSKLTPEQQVQKATEMYQSQRQAVAGMNGGGSGAVTAPGAPSLY